MGAIFVHSRAIAHSELISLVSNFRNIGSGSSREALKVVQKIKSLRQ